MSGKSRKYESPNEKDQQNRDYLKNYINPILEPLVKELLLEKPENVHEFIIDFVRNDLKSSGSSSSPSKGGQSKGKEKQEYQFPESGSEEEEEESEDVAPLSKEVIQKKSHTRHSVSAEAFGQYNKRSIFNPRVVPKTPEQVQTIVEKLSKSFMFSVLDEKQQKIVIDALDVKKYKKDDWIIKQGDDGDVLYIVQEGNFECYKRFAKDQEPKMVKTYGPGDSFGELALLYNAPRAASIKAVTDCTLCLLDRETFNAIVKDAEVQRRERFEKTLEKVNLLSTMDPYERTKLSDVIKIEKYKAGDYVIRQGEEGHTFYLVEEGSATCTKVLQGKSQPEVVLNYKAGDYFGELALLRNEPRQANVIADSDLSLLVLDREVFNRVLGPLKEILARNAKKYEEFM